MSDASYMPKVYREQGGDRMVVAPGGELLIEGAIRGLIKGQAFYVDSAVGSNSNDGTSWTRAVATIDYAVGLCTAGRGDIIFVAPGHVETVTAAAGLNLDVSGITIIGIGNGRLRPKVNFTTAVTADMDVGAANITVENIYFDLTSIDSLDAALDINAADFTLRNCEIEMSDASGQCDIALVYDDNCDRMTIEGCYFHGAGDTTAQIAIDGAGADDVDIRGNVFNGYFGTTGAIQQATTAGVNWNIVGNEIVNRTADGNNKTIVLHASTVAIIANNRMAVIDSTSPAPLTAAAAFVSGNYSVGAVGVAASTLI